MCSLNTIQGHTKMLVQSVSDSISSYAPLSVLHKQWVHDESTDRSRQQSGQHNGTENTCWSLEEHSPHVSGHASENNTKLQCGLVCIRVLIIVAPVYGNTYRHAKENQALLISTKLTTQLLSPPAAQLLSTSGGQFGSPFQQELPSPSSPASVNRKCRSSSRLASIEKTRRMRQGNKMSSA